MFWEEPKSNGLIEANFYTGEHFRDERNKKAFAEKVTDSLGDIASALDAIQAELQKSTAATQSLGDVLAEALKPPGANGSTTPWSVRALRWLWRNGLRRYQSCGRL